MIEIRLSFLRSKYWLLRPFYGGKIARIWCPSAGTGRRTRCDRDGRSNRCDSRASDAGGRGAPGRDAGHPSPTAVPRGVDHDGIPDRVHELKKGN